MHRVRFAGSYGEVCECLCAAVRVLGAHTPAGRKRPTLESLGPGALAEATWAGDAPDIDAVVLVLEAAPPGPDHGRFIKNVLFGRSGAAKAPEPPPPSPNLVLFPLGP
jgi:hypothetical protein